GAAAGCGSVRADRHQRRPAVPGDAGGRLLGGGAGATRDRARSRPGGVPRRGPRAARTRGPPGAPDVGALREARPGAGVGSRRVNWVAAVEALRRERRAGVLVTLVTVRGHAPREAGAKMVVAADATWDSIGGGNLEATAVARARRLLDAEGTP